MSKTIHFRGLNGIRAIAAVAVLISHILGGMSDFGLNGLGTSLNMASYGVTMFFTLSGFLITYLLLKEKEKNDSNKINVRNFYMRRVLRIWPLYYFFIALSLVVFYLFSVSYSGQNLIFYIFLMANVPFILGQGLPHMGHLWSIAVEEQFYLFWPWIAKVKLDKFKRNMIILIVFLLAFKFLFYMLSITKGIDIPLIAITTNRFYCMVFGGLVGLLYYQKSSIIGILNNIYFSIFCWIILVLSAFNLFQISSALIDHEIISIVTAGIIISQIERKHFIVDLDTKVFNFLGKISYGIYVYHPLIIFILYKTIGEFAQDIWYNYVVIFALVSAVSIGVSYASFHLLEKRFIALKGKFSQVHSSA